MKLAWEHAGKPGASEEAALRNIRKRAAAARSQQPPDEPRPRKKQVIQGPPPAATPAPLVRKNGEQAPCRRTSHQVDAERKAAITQRRPYVEALKAATAEYARLQQEQITRGGTARTGSRVQKAVVNAEALARGYNQTLPDDQQLNGNMIASC